MCGYCHPRGDLLHQYEMFHFQIKVIAQNNFAWICSELSLQGDNGFLFSQL